MKSLCARHVAARTCYPPADNCNGLMPMTASARPARLLGARFTSLPGQAASEEDPPAFDLMQWGGLSSTSPAELAPSAAPAPPLPGPASAGHPQHHLPVWSASPTGVHAKQWAPRRVDGQGQLAGAGASDSRALEGLSAKPSGFLGGTLHEQQADPSSSSLLPPPAAHASGSSLLQTAPPQPMRGAADNDPCSSKSARAEVPVDAIRLTSPRRQDQKAGLAGSSGPGPSSAASRIAAAQGPPAGAQPKPPRSPLQPLGLRLTNASGRVPLKRVTLSAKAARGNLSTATSTADPLPATAPSPERLPQPSQAWPGMGLSQAWGDNGAFQEPEEAASKPAPAAPPPQGLSRFAATAKPGAGPGEDAQYTGWAYQRRPAGGVKSSSGGRRPQCMGPGSGAALWLPSDGSTLSGQRDTVAAGLAPITYASP